MYGGRTAQNSGDVAITFFFYHYLWEKTESNTSFVDLDLHDHLINYAYCFNGFFVL